MKIAFKKLHGQLVPFTDDDYEALQKLKDGAVYEIDVKDMDMRTLQQNKALHKYFAILASVLNSAGYDITKVIKVEIPWSVTSVKELLWRPVMKQQTDKSSTTKLSKDEVSQVYDTLNRALSQRCGVSVEFPSRDE